jgi:hypothetical protein
MDKYVLTTVIAHDETETLLRIEEFNDALAFADDLRRHPATATATATAAAETAAAAATTSETAAAAEAAATITIAAATAKAIAAATVPTATAAAAEPAAVTKTATVAVAVFSENPVALVASATATVALTPFVETHARSKPLCPQIFRTNALGPKSATGQSTLFAHAPFSALAQKSVCLQ